MSRRVLGRLAVGVGLLFAAVPAFAHHSVAAKFDDSKTVTLKGYVSKIDWLNPHAHVYIDVREGNATTVWAIELESPVDLRKGGWTRDSLKIGDGLTVRASSARDGSHQAWAKSVVLTNTGKAILEIPAATQAAARGTAKPTPRWPDGQPRLGPPPGETGYWSNPTGTSLVENAARIQMDAYGLLRNVSDVDKVAPFQRWARDLYELRQRSFLKDDPMYLYCIPPGGPRQFQNSYGTQFVEDHDRKRVFVMMGGGNHSYRIMYTDGRKQQGQLRGDADNPLYWGRAVAKWEKDTLVVDTNGFNDKFWFTNGGQPHTDLLHLTERLTRTDFNTLKYEVTIDDAGAYTRPWSTTWNLQWMAGEELPTYFCQDNRP